MPEESVCMQRISKKKSPHLCHVGDQHLQHLWKHLKHERKIHNKLPQWVQQLAGVFAEKLMWGCSMSKEFMNHQKNPANLFWHTELSAMGSRTRNWTWGSQCQVCWPKTHSLRSHLLWSRWRVDNNVRGGWVAEAPNNMWCCGHRLGSTPSADEGGVYIWQVMLVVGSFSGALDKLWCSYVFMAIGLVGFPSVSFPTYGRYGVFQARSPFDGGYLRPLI
jgi:hypothetical protein